MNNIISLCGEWRVDYMSDSPYCGKDEPVFTSGCRTVCPVPGYWEDFGEQFEKSGLIRHIKTNPRYIEQKYPQTEYVPDTEFPNPVGCFVYKRSFDLTEDVRETESSLLFGGVQNTVSAWINGVFIGRHEGYSAPFSFDIPVGTLVYGENRVTLAVSNNRLRGYGGNPVSGVTSRAACECTGGIYGDVNVVFRPDGLRDVTVRTEKDLRKINIRIIGAEGSEKRVCLSDGYEILRSYIVPAGRGELEISTEGLKTWEPGNPVLYTLSVKTDNQEISVRFGVRRMTVDGTRLMLNGKPFYFRGACEHFYQPESIHPTRDRGYYRMVIKRLQEFGFNSLRFHTWIPPVEYLDAADELGMVIEAESPNNTALDEWREIVAACGNHPSVCIYSTGNELMIDNDYEAHLRACADIVHRESDSLFSPMSAMRGVEYFLDNEKSLTEAPFLHKADRLARISEYCDLYNSYSLGLTSYNSITGTSSELDLNNSVFGKPLLSHEIGIFGTYIDLSLEDRYKGSRMGQTEFMSSVRRHLEERGLLGKSEIYYRNSVRWQEILRKQCFETVRRCESFAGYDYLGPIDTHWHTFGYCVGFMNEFYELKYGLTADEILRYNSPMVLLCDIPGVNRTCGEKISIPFFASNYSERVTSSKLIVEILRDGQAIDRFDFEVGEIPVSAVTKLAEAKVSIPESRDPMKLTIKAELTSASDACENSWDIYAFPAIEPPSRDELDMAGVDVLCKCTEEQLAGLLEQGRRVVIFGAGPFGTNDVSWQISLAGRTEGHLATVIADHPLMRDFPHDGLCGRQFETMMEGCSSVILDRTGLPHEPVIDIATSYKNARREALIFEYAALNGSLLVASLRFDPEDPAAMWLKNKILKYAAGDEFRPEEKIDAETLHALCMTKSVGESVTVINEAFNMNDITMSRKK